MLPLADAFPPLDLSYWIALVSRVAHVLTGAILVGGLAYLRCVVVPGATVTSEGDNASAYFGAKRRNWALIVMACTLLLLLSGVYNLMIRIRSYELPMEYHILFGIKFVLALVVFFAAALVSGRSPAAERARSNVTTWLNAALVCALLLFVTAAALRTVIKAPKQPQARGADASASIPPAQADAGSRADLG